MRARRELVDISSAMKEVYKMTFEKYLAVVRNDKNNRSKCVEVFK
jgi:hypothetical protein